MEAREEKGLEIAAKSKLQQSGDRWFVPSQTGRGAYSQSSPTLQSLIAVVLTLKPASFAANIFRSRIRDSTRVYLRRETQTQTLPRRLRSSKPTSKSGLPTTRRRPTRRKSFWSCLQSCARALKSQNRKWVVRGCRLRIWSSPARSKSIAALVVGVSCPTCATLRAKGFLTKRRSLQFDFALP